MFFAFYSLMPKKKGFQQEWIFAIAVILVVFLAVFVFLSIQNPYTYKYVKEQENVVFLSNEKDPSVFLSSLRDYETFVISPVFSENVSSTQTGKALVLFSSVLISKDKNVVTLLRSYSGDSLEFCQTNFGDSRTSVQISSTECLFVIEDTSNALFFFEEPNNSLKKPEVVLEKNKVLVKPKVSADISLASYISLKTMYFDSDEVINLINHYANELN